MWKQAQETATERITGLSRRETGVGYKTFYKNPFTTLILKKSLPPGHTWIYYGFMCARRKRISHYRGRSPRKSQYTLYLSAKFSKMAKSALIAVEKDLDTAQH
jgi:hypothetical protein